MASHPPAGDADDSVPRTWLFTGIGGVLGTAFCEAIGGKGRLIGIGLSNLPPGSLAYPWEPAEASGPAACFGYLADLWDDEVLEGAVRAAVDAFGSVDVVVNAARRSWHGPVTELGSSLDSLEEQFYLNVVVPARLTALVVDLSWRHTPEANQARKRHVVNLSSTAGHIVYPGQGQGAYASAKAAVNMLTRHQAVELKAIGVRANAVAPNTFPHIVSTASVVQAVLDLDDSSRTGEILVVDSDGSHWM